VAEASWPLSIELLMQVVDDADGDNIDMKVVSVFTLDPRNYLIRLSGAGWCGSKVEVVWEQSRVVVRGRKDTLISSGLVGG
jgi:hypothetical protein